MLSHFNGVQLFETPWTVAHQAPLSMELHRKEYRSGLAFPSPGDLPDQGIEPHLLRLCIDRQALTISTTWEAPLVPRSWGLTKKGLCREGTCHFQAALCSGPTSLVCGWQEENVFWAQVSPSSTICYQLPHVPTPQWGCWQKIGWLLGCPAHSIPAGGSLHHHFQKSRRRPSFTAKGLPPF